MKKNAIGHMVAEKQPVSVKIRHWRILPKLLCLLLALVIWLVVTNLTSTDQNAPSSNPKTEVTDS